MSFNLLFYKFSPLFEHIHAQRWKEKGSLKRPIEPRMLELKVEKGKIRKRKNLQNVDSHNSKLKMQNASLFLSLFSLIKLFIFDIIETFNFFKAEYNESFINEASYEVTL